VLYSSENICLLAWRSGKTQSTEITGDGIAGTGDSCCQSSYYWFLFHVCRDVRLCSQRYYKLL